MAGVWEDHVGQISIDSRPRDAHALSEEWKAFNDGVSSVWIALIEIFNLTENDKYRPLTDQEEIAMMKGHLTLPKGKKWAGAAADAYRAHVDKLGKAFLDLNERGGNVQRSVERCAKILSTAIAGIPVPVFYDKELPGGTDVEGTYSDPNTFATKLTDDRMQGREWYGPHGFRQRAIAVYKDEWYGQSGSIKNGHYDSDNRAKVGWNDSWGDGWDDNMDNGEGAKKIGWWWNDNNSSSGGVATTFGTDLDSESSKLTLGEPKVKFDTKTIEEPDDPSNTPGGPGDIGGPGMGSLPGSWQNQPWDNQSELPGSWDGPAGGNPAWGDTTPDPWENKPWDNQDDPQTWENRPWDDTDGGGSGLAGVSSTPGAGFGTGPAGGVGGGFSTVSGAGVGGAVPGQLAPGTVGSGSGRAPMGPITDPMRFLADQNKLGANAGVGGFGMMGGGMGAGAGGEGGLANNTWLREDEDVWGADEGDAAPGVLR